jgi:hypothetical protein
MIFAIISRMEWSIIIHDPGARKDPGYMRNFVMEWSVSGYLCKTRYRRVGGKQIADSWFLCILDL